MPDYPPEQLWPLYEKLPEDLQEAIFSEKTAEAIYDICTRYKLEREKISEVAKNIGYVMLGLLPPDEFQATLKEEIKLKNELAKKINQEINRFIFFPLKSTLETIYKIKMTSTTKPPEITPSEEKPEEKPKEVKRDIYREPIE